jgi:hypothetical protein
MPGQRNELAKSDWGSASFGITWKNNYLYAGTGSFFEAYVLQGIVRWKAELCQDIYQIDQEEKDAHSEEGLRRLSRDELRRVLRNPPRDDTQRPGATIGVSKGQALYLVSNLRRLQERFNAIVASSSYVNALGLYDSEISSHRY